MLRTVALLLTGLTGFSGLVYEVAWERLLASLLGSHSEATAAVLGLFLCGLSLGYALFGRVARQHSNATGHPRKAGSLLIRYGVVECGIGGFALLFPWLFAGVQLISLSVPEVAPAMRFAIDVCLAALLVLTPAVLMGGTIPLLTQGLAHRMQDATRLHSLVYAINSGGAFVGALTADFFLIPSFGLESTIRAMGWINLAAGGIFVALGARESARRADYRAAEPGSRPHSHASTDTDCTPSALHLSAEWLTPYAIVAALSGFAMMALQTTLNRIGALSLGASQFTFAMVVALFVLCIALGSLGVALLRRIRPAYVAVSQWLIVVYLVVLYPAVENAPFWAHVVQLRTGEGSGIGAYYAIVFVLFLGILVVPLGLSGALLPLLFHHAKREVVGLGHVAGRLYSWNTAGSLIGALVGGYLLLFWIDLHAVYRLAVVALAVGAAILTPRVGLAGRTASAVALVGIVAVVSLQPAWEPRRLSAGLFRAHFSLEALQKGPDAYFASPISRGIGDRVLFYTDDPASSVAVFEFGPEDAPRMWSIAVDGKSDGNIPADNMTTGLLALLPALFAETCERAFVIGLGAGMTAGELAALESTHEVVVAEVSTGVVEASRLFEGVNRGALHSPKTRVVLGDAYRTLLHDEARYDVIVSEPSNPWVTGVEMLYSVDFLRAARGRLSPGGVYAQWFHTYETDDASVALVLRSFREAFEHVAVWNGDPSDLVILGFTGSDRALDVAALERRFESASFKAQFTALSLTFPRLLAHERLPLDVVRGIDLGDQVHTLAHPRLSDTAARAFYRHSSATAPQGLGHLAAEAGERNSLVRRWRALRGKNFGDEERLELLRETCDLDLYRCATLFAQWLREEPDSTRLAETLELARASASLASVLRPEILARLVSLFGPDAGGALTPSFSLVTDLRETYSAYYHHAAPFNASILHGAWERCAGTDPRCQEALDEVHELGASSTPSPEAPSTAREPVDRLRSNLAAWSAPIPSWLRQP